MLNEILYFRSVRAWKYHEMIDERSSSSILRKTISESQKDRLIGHQKVAGSIPDWGSEAVFLRIELVDRSFIIS